MDEARVFPVRVNGQQTCVLMSAEEVLEAAEQGRLLIAPAEVKGASEGADSSPGEASEGDEGRGSSVPAIVQRIRGIAGRVPTEAWDSLPQDLIENLDHYVYGTPKR